MCICELCRLRCLFSAWIAAVSPGSARLNSACRWPELSKSVVRYVNPYREVTFWYSRGPQKDGTRKGKEKKERKKGGKLKLMAGGGMGGGEEGKNDGEEGKEGWEVGRKE